ncbi:MAG: esterase-like activity of phytase family protein [Sulfitobacter sp.]
MIRLAFVVICLCGSAWAEPSLKANGALRWEVDAPWFGGWSGIEITASGTKMTALSDRGQLVQATLTRDQGRLSSVTIDHSVRISDAKGGPLKKLAVDSEGLAIQDTGPVHVSFEHRHRIMDTDPETGRTSGLIKLPFRKTMSNNGGLEALAISADGTLFTLPETAPPDGAPFPLYAYKDGQWHVSAHIPQRGPFLPVGADFDSSGRLWLLERTVTPLGFRSRVRLFVFDGDASREYTLLNTIPARYDNLEGITAWDDPKGQMHITMISDDNFLPIQSTQIVDYLVLE